MPDLILSPSADSTRASLRFARVIPLVFITYSLAYLDRVNWGFAESGGMRETLHLSPKISSLTAAAFFLGYCIFQIPGGGYAARHSARRMIFLSLFLWGLISVATGLVRSVPLLITLRISLGVVEGVVLPSLLVFVTHWFTRKERSRANTLFILGNPVTVTWASAVSGYVVEYFNRHPVGHLAGWQMMFVVEGLPSVIWAFLWLALAKDRPVDAAWLGPAALATQRTLDHEQQSIPHVENYLAAFRDLRVLLLCGQFFAWSVGIYGLVMWLPAIVKVGANQGVGRSGLLTAAPYLLGCVAMFTVSVVSDRSLVRKAFVWPPMFIGGIALYGSYLAGPSHFWLAFVGLTIAGVCMYAPYGPYWAMIGEMLPKNVRGESMALINTAGAIGGGVGTFFVGWMKDAVSLGAAFMFMAASLMVAGVLTLLVRPEGRSGPLSPRYSGGRGIG